MGTGTRSVIAIVVLYQKVAVGATDSAPGSPIAPNWTSASAVLKPRKTILTIHSIVAI